MDYNFNELEKKWQGYLRENETYKVSEDDSKEKYYVLDMFPYPSGAGLHVGHPLGYIASDIFARYKKLKGFNVLHQMGYDSFGLPTEQYAIQTGIHPAIATKDNTERYRKQLYQIGFSFDWSREVQTSDPSYYKWTQWIFKQLFNSCYCNVEDKAMPISDLTDYFEKQGNLTSQAVCDDNTPKFSDEDWNSFSEVEKEKMLLHYRLAFLSDTWVNWCEGLGTVLANDEVKDGLSERGGFPVEQKLMKQWSLRITAYADRLISGLDTVDWSDSIKEIQKNWIGKSKGLSFHFDIKNNKEVLQVFTTRPDTIFGTTYCAIALDHPLSNSLKTKNASINKFINENQTNKKTEAAIAKQEKIGIDTGLKAIHPITKDEIPIWIANFVLMEYGSGAVMCVPGHDQRDYEFAKKYKLPILQVIETLAGENIDEHAL